MEDSRISRPRSAAVSLRVTGRAPRPPLMARNDHRWIEHRMGPGVGRGCSRTVVALPSAGDRAHRRQPSEGLQRVDALPLFPNASRVAWAISLALCRNKSISDRVNIRRTGEIPSFRLSMAVEGVTEAGTPPPFEVPSMLSSEFMQLLRVASGKYDFMIGIRTGNEKCLALPG